MTEIGRHDVDIARLRRLGEWLDTVIDDGLNIGLILATGIGLARLEGSALWLVLGVAGAAMQLFYVTVAYRTLLAQGSGGEFLRIRWWFNSGRESKALASSDGVSAMSIVYAAGRRDVFCFAWFLLAALGWPKAILVWALIFTTSNLVVAVGPG